MGVSFQREHNLCVLHLFQICGAIQVSHPQPSPKNALSSQERGRKIESLIYIAERIAKTFHRKVPKHILYDDLLSSGIVGLVDAGDRYDPGKCGSIERYAQIRVRGAILDELRSLDWASRSLRRLSTDVKNAAVELSQKLGRDPSAEELANHLGISLDSFHEMLHRIRPAMMISLDHLSAGPDNVRSERSHGLPDPDSPDPSFLLHHKKLYDMIEEELLRMEVRARLVIKLYHFHYMTLKQIGVAIGVTESRVSQILTQVQKLLKKTLALRIDGEEAQIDY